MENPIKMDDDWGYPYFRKPPYGVLNQVSWLPLLCSRQPAGAPFEQKHLGSSKKARTT